MILYGPINAVFPLMTLDYFDGTTKKASIIEIAFSIGMLLGSLAIGISGGIKKRGIGIPFSIFMLGVPIALSGLLPVNGFWFFALFCIVMGLSVPFYNAPGTALFQERIPPEYLGRVYRIR